MFSGTQWSTQRELRASPSTGPVMRVTVRSSDNGGGGRACARAIAFRLTVRDGPLGALAARVWTP